MKKLLALVFGGYEAYNYEDQLNQFNDLSGDVQGQLYIVVFIVIVGFIVKILFGAVFSDRGDYSSNNDTTKKTTAETADTTATE